MEIQEKSIQELESDFWPDQQEYLSGLIERCHEYRKVKVKDLQIHQIITLLIQDIGAEFLMPLVLERMDKDIAEEDGFDGSSFIESIDLFSDGIFKRNPNLHQATMEVLGQKKDEIEALIGWKRYDRILMKIGKKR